MENSFFFKNEEIIFFEIKCKKLVKENVSDSSKQSFIISTNFEYFVKK